MRDEDLKKGKRYCIRLLSVRARSEFEIRSRLEEKGYAEDIADEIIKGLKRDGLVDDLKFANDWIESRMASSPRSVNMLRRELESKGLDRVVTEKALFAERDMDDSSTARELLRKKIAEKKERTGVKLKARLYRFLLGKGFDAELAEELIEEELGDNSV